VTASPSLEDLCKDEAAIALGYSGYANKQTYAADTIAEAKCMQGNNEWKNTATQQFVKFGGDSTANQALCVAPYTYSTVTCANVLTELKANKLHPQLAALCCGEFAGATLPSSYEPLKGSDSELLASGEVTMSLFTDSGCNTTKSQAAAHDFGEIYTVTPHVLGACVEGPKKQGVYMSMTACNSTHANMNGFVKSGCKNSYFFGAVKIPLNTCVEGTSPANNTAATYYKAACTGTAPTEKIIVSKITTTLAGLPANPTATQKADIKRVYETTALAQYKLGLGDDTLTNIKESHSYTGVLADARRRRLEEAERRRLSTGEATAASTFSVVVPLAKAQTVSNSLGSSTDFSAATFQSKVVSDLQADTATASFANNITATAVIVNEEPAICSGETCSTDSSTATTGGSTSGASEMQGLAGLTALVAVGVALLM